MNLRNLFTKNKNKNIEPVKKQRVFTRNYDGAIINRLVNDWITGTQKTEDEILKSQLRTLQQRSRDLARNNSYVKKYIKVVSSNVIGDTGVLLQNRAKDPSGKLDILANRLIEDAWYIWGKKGNCDVTTQLSWLDVQRLVMETVVRDGECFVRIVRGYDNKYNFALQIIESDYIEVTYKEEKLSNGNIKRNGIEYNQWGKPIAYYIDEYEGQIKTHTTKIPASEIIHIYYKERSTQNRGIPWITPVIRNLRDLKGFIDAEIIASRVGASQMGIITSPPDAEYTGNDVDTPVLDVEPGTFKNLPQGYDVKMFDPKHPNIDTSDFIKAILRSISAGIGISYNVLSSDLESVNYSSLRQGALEDRDNYKTWQEWVIDNFINPVFESWLEIALLMQYITLPIAKYDKFNNPFWLAKRWAWVDPKKDIESAILAIDNKLISRSDVCANSGYSFEEIIEKLAEEEDLIKKYQDTNEKKTITTIEGKDDGSEN